MSFSIRPFCRFPVHCAVIYNAGLFLKLPLVYCLGFGSLITLLLLSSGPAYAEWIKIVENDQTGLTVYADPMTVRRDGDLVKLWALDDFMTIQTVEGISYWSSKSQMEFECLEERARWLALAEFSGNMGKGEVVYYDATEGKWQPVVPESVGRMLWKAACGKE
jgi:hypothetical protein